MTVKQLSVLATILLAMGCRSGVKIEDGSLIDTATPADPNSEADSDENDDDSDENEEDDDEQEEDGDEDDKPDDWEDEDDDKPDDDGDWGFSDCAEDFDPALPCDGAPEQTICVYEDTIWWCQDGVWMNEDNKPE